MNASRSCAVVLVLCCVLLLGSAVVWAADPAPKVQRITITKVDGKTVAGEFVDATPAGVRVKPSPKVDAVLVPWAEVQRTTNNLDRKKIVAEWRLTKADQLCPTCTGEGTQNCAACGGTAVEPAGAKECDTCHGSGDVGKCPKCTDGKVACPSPCLKAESFSGAKDAEGKRWRTFRGKSGGLRISDGHVGEQVVMEGGDPVMKGKCPTCAGTTKITCPTCEGTAKKECAKCHGGGKTGPACPTCTVGRTACDVCRGSGLKATP
ncbi:MAG TPA: hypothetical protein VF595_08550 [Tepidisphaeraceae bacterium]|jgi:hypothetical protein